MFQIGDKISHPLHGGGIIETIIKEKINRQIRDYYVLKLSQGSVTLKVPVEGSNLCGLRPLISLSDAEAIFKAIPGMDSAQSENWNRRHFENMSLIKSGDPFLVANAIKKLIVREKGKGLSTGEYKMLSQAKQILLTELAMVYDCKISDMEDRLLCQCLLDSEGKNND